ncbi:hypothetical protein ACYSNM_03725 [Myroides sp. LJL116]
MNKETLQEKWDQQGKEYANKINAFVEKGDRLGWENLSDKDLEEPLETRFDLAFDVVELLKKANKENTVEKFREEFAPSTHALEPYLKDKGCYIGDIIAVDFDVIAFMQGTAHQERQAYLATGTKVVALDPEIKSFGKSLQNDIFAIVYNDYILTKKAFDGDVIHRFELGELHDIGISKVIPFNDGLRVLIASNSGIYVLDKQKQNLLTLGDTEDEPLLIDMENACLSLDNSYVVVASQDSNFLVLDTHNGYSKVGDIGPLSSYPHFCLFSADNTQLITNSCHFYNGETVGVNTEDLPGLDLDPYEQTDKCIVLDQEMRVYQGVALNNYYILGDAYGYIRAIDTNGKHLWKHFLGSTISGMSLSVDKNQLYVATYSGIVHKLTLNKKVRDAHAIGNADIYEDFRLFILQNEEDPIFYW